MANYSNLKFNSDYASKSLTLDGISFNHVIHLDTGHATLLGRGTWGTTNASGTLNDNNYAVNAVDINWNGATPGLGESSSTGITTTGELLKYIKQYATIKTQLGTTAIGSATKPIYWNGSSFVAANNYPSGVSTLTLTKTGTSTIDLLANTTYTLTVGDKTLAFKTPTVTDGSNILAWGSNVTLATVGSVTIDAKLPSNPVTSNAIADLGFTKNTGTVTKVKVGSTEYTPSSGVVSLPAYPPTYSQGTNITISSNTISHATPTAKTNIKGNKTTQLLATITTDSQGHVTDYDVITPSELWNLLKSYADALYEPKSTTVAVTGISLNKSSLFVSANGTGTITATITPSNATNKNVTWTSSDTSIATVTTSTTSGNAATVTWKAAGSVTITAKAAGNTSKTATCEVTCNPVPVTASASIGSTSISRPKNSTLASISWSGGSAPATIESGKTGTLTKGTVTGTYGNDNTTTTVTTSNFINKPTITSSNTNVISVGTVVKNGSTTLTAKAAGSTTITVKDGSTLIESWNVTVTNASNTSNVTSSVTFSATAGSISGTTITAPTVTADTTVTITAKYGGKTASQTVTYTAKKATPSTTYYSYVGTDLSGKLVNPSTGALKSDIATQIKSISGVKTYNSVPSSLTTGTTINANDYVYVIAPTSTLNKATTYLVNQSNMNVVTETLGTFTIDSTEYTVKCTPSEVTTVVTAWK